MNKLQAFQRGFFTRLVTPDFHIIEKEINQSQAKEAADIGLTLQHRSNNPNYNLYRHNECGHVDYYQPTHVRRNNITCKTCLLFKNAKEAVRQNFNLVHKDEGTYYKYIRPCGHVSVLNPQSVGNSSGKNCSQCFDEELLQVCDRNGYIYNNRTTGCYHSIGFKSCTHEKTVHHSQIFKGNVVCRECNQIESKQLALDNGLVELSQENDRYFKYQLPCGHEKVLRQDHAIDGSYLCDYCGESHYRKSSNLYLYKFTLDSFSWLKLGFARNLNLRKANYGLDKNVITELLLTIEFDSGRDVMLFEKKLHKIFREHRLDKNLMKSFHKNNGHSECYVETASNFMIDRIWEEYERIKWLKKDLH